MNIDREVGSRLGASRNFSTDIAAAYQIVERLQREGFFVELMVTPRLTRRAISLSNTGAQALKDKKPGELALAICEAYLDLKRARP